MVCCGIADLGDGGERRATGWEILPRGNGMAVGTASVCWDKVIPLHFEAGRAVYEVHHAPKVFRLATETGYSSWFFVGDKRSCYGDRVEYRSL